MWQVKRKTGSFKVGSRLGIGVEKMAPVGLVGKGSSGGGAPTSNVLVDETTPPTLEGKEPAMVIAIM